MCGFCYNHVFTLWLLWLDILKEGRVYIMIKAYEIVKENKLMIDCKNGDLIQFGKHLHIILLP